MRDILVLGAGQSAPYLIQYLLDHAEDHDWRVVVADRDESLAQARVKKHPRGEARFVDAKDTAMVKGLMKDAGVVVNFLAPAFQYPVARLCVDSGTHMVSASYMDERVRALSDEAADAGVTLLCELGLDPGLDHMSAMKLIHEVQAQGAVISSFASYGSGVPAPDSRSNPLGYAITWNPRNVVMAGEPGAQYLHEGKVKVVPYPEVFHRTWPFEVEGLGTMEAYPNRDSISYQDVYGLAHVETLIRGTLRYPGFSETWYQVARLGLPNEGIHIPRLGQRTWAELTEMFLPPGTGEDLVMRVASYLGISPSGVIMDNLRWLGLFSEQPTGVEGDTAAEAVVALLKDRLRLGPTERDMVVLSHELFVTYPERGGAQERVTSTMIQLGEPSGMTAMAMTVGLPAAIGTRLLMTDAFPRTGAHIPTDRAIYQPMLRELETAGITFRERSEAI